MQSLSNENLSTLLQKTNDVIYDSARFLHAITTEIDELTRIIISAVEVDHCNILCYDFGKKSISSTSTTEKSSQFSKLISDFLQSTFSKPCTNSRTIKTILEDAHWSSDDLSTFKSIILNLIHTNQENVFSYLCHLFSKQPESHSDLGLATFARLLYGLIDLEVLLEKSILLHTRIDFTKNNEIEPTVASYLKKGYPYVAINVASDIYDCYIFSIYGEKDLSSTSISNLLNATFPIIAKALFQQKAPHIFQFIIDQQKSMPNWFEPGFTVPNGMHQFACAFETFVGNLGSHRPVSTNIEYQISLSELLGSLNEDSDSQKKRTESEDSTLTRIMEQFSFLLKDPSSYQNSAERHHHLQLSVVKTFTGEMSAHEVVCDVSLSNLTYAESLAVETILRLPTNMEERWSSSVRVRTRDRLDGFWFTPVWEDNFYGDSENSAAENVTAKEKTFSTGIALWDFLSAIGKSKQSSIAAGDEAHDQKIHTSGINIDNQTARVAHGIVRTIQVELRCKKQKSRVASDETLVKRAKQKEEKAKQKEDKVKQKTITKHQKNPVKPFKSIFFVNGKPNSDICQIADLQKHANFVISLFQKQQKFVLILSRFDIDGNPPIIMFNNNSDILLHVSNSIMKADVEKMLKYIKSLKTGNNDSLFSIIFF